MKKTGKILISIIGLAIVLLGAYLIYDKLMDSHKTNSDDIVVESPYNFRIPTGYSADIEPYINFLKTNKQIDPVDYVISLFDKYDIVVLGERNHNDITQYELFYKIISDKRFIKKSGYVFTEVGSQTINNRLNNFLQAKDLNESEVNTELIDIYRNISSEGYWEKYNFYYFLNKIHYLNNSLPKGQKVQVNCSDMPVDWDNVTPQSYTEQFLKRDKIMADFISSKYKERITSKSNKKCLVIMNSRHAFKEHMGSVSNTTAYLNKEFPGKIANVMINALRGLPGSNDKEDVNEPMQNGKWDAAFRYLKNINTAFDFKNSPFGEDRFDYYDSEKHKEYKYQDIFNGFIFYYPLEKHLLVSNVPGIMNSDFFVTLYNRLKSIKNDMPDVKNIRQDDINQEVKNKNTLIKSFYPDIMKFNSEIERWLKY